MFNLFSRNNVWNGCNLLLFLFYFRKNYNQQTNCCLFYSLPGRLQNCKTRLNSEVLTENVVLDNIEADTELKEHQEIRQMMRLYCCSGLDCKIMIVISQTYLLKIMEDCMRTIQESSERKFVKFAIPWRNETDAEGRTGGHSATWLKQDVIWRSFNREAGKWTLPWRLEIRE